MTPLLILYIFYLYITDFKELCIENKTISSKPQNVYAIISQLKLFYDMHKPNELLIRMVKRKGLKPKK